MLPALLFAQVKVILMSATFDCQVFAEYFSMEIRGSMQRAPVYDVAGQEFRVQEKYWSYPPLCNMVAVSGQEGARGIQGFTATTTEVFESVNYTQGLGWLSGKVQDL